MLRRFLVIGLGIACGVRIAPRMGNVELAPRILATLRVGEARSLQRPSSGHSFSARRMASRPHAFQLEGLLSDAECDHFIKLASAKGMTSADADGRTGCDLSLIYPEESGILNALRYDMAQLLFSEDARGPGSFCEDLQILKYEPAGEFKFHYDTSPEQPRGMTILYYLNSVGATWFPFAHRERDPAGADEYDEWMASLTPSDGLRIEAKRGDALAFYHFSEEGSPDLLALHAGLPAPSERWVGTHFYFAGRPGLQGMLQSALSFFGVLNRFGGSNT